MLRFHGGKLVERTRDDSVVQILFERGEVKEEEMGMQVMVSPNLQPLTFTLTVGGTELVDIEVQSGGGGGGDRDLCMSGDVSSRYYSGCRCYNI